MAHQPTVIVHAGDFDYIDSPSTFLRNIDAVVPESIIYLATIGNHDEDAWDGSSGYQALLLDRLARSNATQYCDGDFGVSGACYIGGMYFVLSGVGTQGVGHVDYLQDAFSAVPAVWKVTLRFAVYLMHPPPLPLIRSVSGTRTSTSTRPVTSLMVRLPTSNKI